MPQVSWCIACVILLVLSLTSVCDSNDPTGVTARMLAAEDAVARLLDDLLPASTQRIEEQVCAAHQDEASHGRTRRDIITPIHPA